MNQRLESFSVKSWGLLLILFVFLILAIIRVTGPTDIHRGDQWKQADYVVDIMVRGNWWMQHHNGSEIASKPPLYNWLAAPLFIAKSEPSDFLLKLPSLIAAVITLILMWDLVGRLMGWKVALYTGLFLVTSSMFAKQMYFARTDMFMVMLIVAQIWAAIRWSMKDQKNKSNKEPFLWTLWIAGGLGLITKGPIVMIMPHLVLATTWIWQGKFRQNYKRLGLTWGLPIALIPMGLWILGVIYFEGWQALGLGYEKWVVTETVNRFDPNSEPGETRGLFYYLWPTIARTMPWSIFAIVSLFWVPWKHLKKSLTLQNQGLILAICWILAILLMLSVVPSKRIVRLFPVVPAVCLLAGWGYVGLLDKIKSSYLPKSKDFLISSFLVGLVVLGIGLDKHIFSEPTRRPDITYAKQVAKALRNEKKDVLVHASLDQPWRYFLLQPKGHLSNETILNELDNKLIQDVYIIGNADHLAVLEKKIETSGLASVDWQEKVGNISIEGGLGVVHLLRKE